MISRDVPVQERKRTVEQEAELARADEFIAGIIDIPGFSRQEERTPTGTDFETAQQAQAYNPFEIIYMVPKSEIPHIYIDAGTEDSLVTNAREYMGVLLMNGVPLDFMQSNGGHKSEYWRRSNGHLMTKKLGGRKSSLGNRPRAYDRHHQDRCDAVPHQCQPYSASPRFHPHQWRALVPVRRQWRGQDAGLAPVARRSGGGAEPCALSGRFRAAA